ALVAVKKLKNLTKIDSRPAELQSVEEDLAKSLRELKKRHRIHGVVLTTEELVNPIQEKEVGDLAYEFRGGDPEMVAEVLREEAKAQVVEISSDSDDEEKELTMTTATMLELCRQLEAACLLVDVD